MRFLRVNEVARELGVSESWLRRAEGRAGIPRARRDLNGRRVYGPEDIAALRAALLPRTPEGARQVQDDGQDGGGARL